jgi:uncharacterized protein
MLQQVLKFAAVCRAGDLRVSTSEAIDAVSQLQWIDLAEEQSFRALLRANFAKSRREQDNFDRLYNLFFKEMHSQEGFTPDTHDQGDTFHIIEKLRQDLTLQEPIDQALIDFLQGEPEAFLNEIRRLDNQEEYNAPGLKSNLGQLAVRLSVMLRINAVRSAVGRVGAGGSSGQPSAKSTEAATRHLDRKLDRAYRMLTEDRRPNNDALKKVTTGENHFREIGERSFGALSPAEITQLQEIIRKFVRKLKDRMGRRYAAASRRYLDVKRTLRHAGRFQGIPIEIKYRHKPLKKAKIVTLCDVSGSVWSAARFMLNVIYSLQDCFSAVHSFAFISGTTDITETFEKNEVQAAIEKVMSSGKIEFGALTDYGEVFHQFARKHLHLVNKRTTLIIVGDGRSNYHNPREEVLAEIREKCRRIIWLNPEPEEFWYTGDSEIGTYKAYCHEIRPCRNLNQLIGFVEDLVL